MHHVMSERKAMMWQWLEAAVGKHGSPVVSSLQATVGTSQQGGSSSIPIPPPTSTCHWAQGDGQECPVLCAHEDSRDVLAIGCKWKNNDHKGAEDDDRENARKSDSCWAPHSLLNVQGFPKSSSTGVYLCWSPTTFNSLPHVILEAPQQPGSDLMHWCYPHSIKECSLDQRV